MKAGLLTLLLAARLAAHAQAGPAAGAPLASFIPPGYQLLGDSATTGDLNFDGRPDRALVLAPLAEDTVAKGGGETGLPPRLLLLLFSLPGGRYQLAAQARQVVLCKGCGGQYDPFDGLSIERGTVVLSQQGGGSGRWSIISKFRYRQGGFYLIGETVSDRNTPEICENLDYPPGCVYRDTNFVTGQYERVRTSANCRVLEHKRGREPVKPLRLLVTYQPQP